MQPARSSQTIDPAALVKEIAGAEHRKALNQIDPYYLSRKYSEMARHLIGLAVCIAGVVLVFYGLLRPR